MIGDRLFAGRRWRREILSSNGVQRSLFQIKRPSIPAASLCPASIDKHFFGNASLVRTGRLNFAADIRTLANVLHADGAEISRLQPLQFIQRDMQSGAAVHGTLKL